MAYAATRTYSESVIAGRRHLLITISETELAAASETTLALGYFPSGKWKIARIKDLLVSGSGATIAPVFGTATDPTSGTVAYVGTSGVAAASHDTTNSGAGFVGDGATLYWRSVPNAGADNVASTKLYLAEGWD